MSRCGASYGWALWKFDLENLKASLLATLKSPCRYFPWKLLCGAQEAMRVCYISAGSSSLYINQQKNWVVTVSCTHSLREDCHLQNASVLVLIQYSVTNFKIKCNQRIDERFLLLKWSLSYFCQLQDLHFSIKLHENKNIFAIKNCLSFTWMISSLSILWMLCIESVFFNLKDKIVWKISTKTD